MSEAISEGTCAGTQMPSEIPNDNEADEITSEHLGTDPQYGNAIPCTERFPNDPSPDDVPPCPTSTNDNLEGSHANYESVFNHHLSKCRDKSGRVIPKRAYKKLNVRRQRQFAQTLQIVAKLQRAGVEVVSSVLTLVGICSRYNQELPTYRNINILPQVGDRNRKQTIGYLGYYLHRNPFCRFWTLTSGGRVLLPELKDRLEWLHRRISRLNNQQFMRDAGMSIVFRTSETAGMRRDIEGRPTYQVHAHVIVKPSKVLGLSEWSQFLTRLQRFWGYHVQDGGMINTPQAASRYLVKPHDLLCLTDQECAEFFHQTQGLHMIQPMGDFRDDIREWKSRKLKPSHSNVNGCEQWQLSPNVNAYINKRSHQPSTSSTAPVENWITTLLEPGYHLSRVSEPYVLVHNFTGDALFDHPLIERIQEAAMPAYLAGMTRKGRDFGGGGRFLQWRESPIEQGHYFTPR